MTLRFSYVEPFSTFGVLNVETRLRKESVLFLCVF